MKTQQIITYVLLMIALIFGAYNYFENKKLQERLELSEANIATMVDFVNKKFENLK